MLSSIGFTQLGKLQFRTSPCIRTFYEPENRVATFGVHEEIQCGKRGIYVIQNEHNLITGTDNTWTLPRSTFSEYAVQTFPTGGTAVYAHAYTAVASVPKESHWRSIASIIERFVHGEAIGIEVLHAALQIANTYNEQVMIPGLTLPHRPCDIRYENIKQRRMKKEEIARWIRETAVQFPIVFEQIETPLNSFIRVGTVEDHNGRTKNYAIRHGIDSQDSICFCWHGGQIFMAIRLGIRAALSGIHGRDGILTIEGVSGSLEEHDLLDEHIMHRACEETREELGIEPAGAMFRLGSFFTAAEITAERSTSVLVEINPDHTCSASHAPDEIQDTRFIELDELLHACEAGIVSNERLEVSARLLKALYQYKNPDVL
jgi:hypothetical protein